MQAISWAAAECPQRVVSGSSAFGQNVLKAEVLRDTRHWRAPLDYPGGLSWADARGKLL